MPQSNNNITLAKRWKVLLVVAALARSVPAYLKCKERKMDDVELGYEPHVSRASLGRSAEASQSSCRSQRIKSESQTRC